MIAEGQLTDIGYQDCGQGVHQISHQRRRQGHGKRWESQPSSRIEARQIFEAIGIKQEVVDRYFTWTETPRGRGRT